MTGQVLFLENEARTIEPEVEVARSLGFEALIFPRPLSLANHLARRPDLPVVAVLLDMRLPPKDLEEIDMPSVKTENGEAVGLAVAERYLRVEEHGYAHVPVGFLTGFDVRPKVQRRIDRLSRSANDAVVLKKGEDVAAFEQFLCSAAAAQADKPYSPADHYRESIQIAASIIWELVDELALRAAIFGIRQEGPMEMGTLERIATAHYNVDFLDRALLIIDMKTSLDAILGPNLERHKEWITTPRRILDGATPLGLISSGHQHDLSRIVGMLRQVLG